MRKKEDGKFKGSLFVEFKTKDSADKVVGIEELRWKDLLISVETKSVVEVFSQSMVNLSVWPQRGVFQTQKQ